MRLFYYLYYISQDYSVVSLVFEVSAFCNSFSLQYEGQAL